MKIIKVKIFKDNNLDIFKYLEENKINYNKHFEEYVLNEKFSLSEVDMEKEIMILTLEEMGFKEPANYNEIINKGNNLGYKICNYNIGFYLRLSYLNQENSSNKILSGQHKAPDSSVTVISNLMEEDYKFPRGLYLRKVDNELWLRGYICDDEYKFDLNSSVAFEVE